ncbi:MAG: hypothetical protein JSW47_15630 [Phycisphaerales bacterium]|nr:MAG: hypothetical protein JSW47_15630 [Phycisphaerales bacterium]
MVYRLSQLVLLAGVVVAGSATSTADVVVRAENFTVPPATGPLAHILARNTGNAECTVTIEPEFPDGWQWTPENREVTLPPGEVKRLPFTIEKALDARSNRYAVKITVVRGSDKVVHQQSVVCASAPYFTPKIDGKFKDWSDAIPVTFTTAGKKTIVSTYWSRRHFYLYVQVEEDKLCSHKKDAGQVDAVQFAIAPSDAETPSVAKAEAQRSEFLLVDVGGMFGKDKCFQLVRPGQELSLTQLQRTLEALQLKDAQVAVKRQGKITHYECAIPFSAVPTVRPAVGREIRFSILVHDPDGTGIRDWGKAAGLWPEQRNPLAWCKWSHVEWPADPPYDSKVEFGLCSSKR